MKRGQKMELENSIKDCEKKIDHYKKLLSDNDKIQIILRHVSEYAKNQIKEKIEKVVTNALNIIYGSGHEFIIELQERRNQHEVDYYLKDGHSVIKIEKPFIGKGGGKITVIALGLQLAVCELTGVTGPIFLDEISKMMDSEARINLGYFLKEYSREFNRQIVLITHHEEIANIANTAIHISKNSEGIANIEVLHEN